MNTAKDRGDIVGHFVYLGSELMTGATCSNEIKGKMIIVETMLGETAKMLRRRTCIFETEAKLASHIVQRVNLLNP